MHAECAWIMCVCIIRSQTVWSVNRQRKKRLLINCHDQLFVSLSQLSGYALYCVSFCVCVCTQCAQQSWLKSTERWLLSGCLIVEHKVHAALYRACRHTSIYRQPPLAEKLPVAFCALHIIDPVSLTAVHNFFMLHLKNLEEENRENELMFFFSKL